jgi:hypothetical protein
MATLTQEPVAKAPKQAALNEQAARNAVPSSSVSAISAGESSVTHKRGKLWTWLAVMMLILLVAGSGFAWAEWTKTDLRATLADAWHRVRGGGGVVV